MNTTAPTPYRISLIYNASTPRRRRFYQKFTATAPKGTPERATEISQFINRLHGHIWIPTGKPTPRCTVRFASITRHFDTLPSPETLLTAKL